MGIKTLKYPAILALFFMCAAVSGVFAEQFKVVHSLSGVDDLSRLEEISNINVDLTGLTSDKEKVKRVCEEVLRKATEKQEDSPEKIIFSLKDIQNMGSIWYADYNWQFESEFKRKNALNRLFTGKLNLKDNIIVYEKDAELQFSVGTE